MKNYYLKFGSGDPSNFTGLTPTLTIFSAEGLTAITAPGITELPAGSGLYRFQYGATNSIIFKADGGAALADSDRYIVGVLDPIQAVDEKMGDFAVDSYGTTATDPTTVAGYLKRNQEVLEGNAGFVKSTGVWSIYSRGSTTLLRTKTLSNSVSAANKT